MSEPVNILCIKWGTRYPAAYVNFLYAGVRRHLRRPFRAGGYVGEWLARDDGKHQIGAPHKRLLMSLYAGDDNGAGVYVAFGTKVAMLSFAPATEKKG